MRRFTSFQTGKHTNAWGIFLAALRVTWIRSLVLGSKSFPDQARFALVSREQGLATVVPDDRVPRPGSTKKSGSLLLRMLPFGVARIVLGGEIMTISSGDRPESGGSVHGHSGEGDNVEGSQGQGPKGPGLDEGRSPFPSERAVSPCSLAKQNSSPDLCPDLDDLSQ
jgi:hypothetical protein